jgi:hypothetical protein
MSATETEASTEVLTIDEAAAILRISRNAAYAAARQWRAPAASTASPASRSAEPSESPEPTSTDCSDDPPDRALSCRQASPSSPLRTARITVRCNC